MDYASSFHGPTPSPSSPSPFLSLFSMSLGYDQGGVGGDGGGGLVHLPFPLIFPFPLPPLPLHHHHPHTPPHPPPLTAIKEFVSASYKLANLFPSVYNIFLSYFLTIPPHPQPPPLPGFNVKKMVNASPPYPPTPLCVQCKYIIKTQMVPLPLPPPPIPLPHDYHPGAVSWPRGSADGEGRVWVWKERKREYGEREREGKGERERDHLCLNDILNNFFSLTLYTEREGMQRGTGRGRSQPWWYICKFLHHKLLNSQRSRMGRGIEGFIPIPLINRLWPPPPHTNRPPPPHLCKCHGEEIGKYIWDLPLGKDSIQGDVIVLDNGPMGPIFRVWIGQTLWVLECTVRDWDAAIFLVQ